MAESTLHQQLKAHYAASTSRTEVRVGRYRIDAIVRGRLIEIQFSSLASIRHKIRELLAEHRVLVVKPIIARKRIVKLARAGGDEIGRRMSPKRCGPISIFDELVYFTDVFPHRRLTLEAPLVEIDELRFPKRRRRLDYSVHDRRLAKLGDIVRLKTRADLWKLAAPRGLEDTFHTANLAQRLNVPRWQAQRIAYCWRHMGVVEAVGKSGASILYRRAA